MLTDFYFLFTVLNYLFPWLIISFSVSIQVGGDTVHQVLVTKELNLSTLFSHFLVFLFFNIYYLHIFIIYISIQSLPPQLPLLSISLLTTYNWTVLILSGPSNPLYIQPSSFQTFIKVWVGENLDVYPSLYTFNMLKILAEYHFPQDFIGVWLYPPNFLCVTGMYIGSLGASFVLRWIGEWGCLGCLA